MSITRRQLLQIASIAPVTASLALPLIAEAKSDLLIKQAPIIVPDHDGWSTQLRMSDLRELLQYSIVPDQEQLRWDVRFSMNARGKWRQFHVDVCWTPPYTRESLNHLREVALAVMQKEFSRCKRIRANLLPLDVPRGMPTVESFLSLQPEASI